MEKRWVYKPLPDPNQVKSLCEALTISEALATLLLQRGIHTFEEAKLFFRPSRENLHDPFLMKDMHKAVHRLLHALEKKEKILIYGDYDVDGTTSVSLVYGFLRSHFSNIHYYIPDRYTEGYGVSTQGIDWAKSQGITLVISLDCGIKSADKIAYASSLGIDFIICDHHLPGDELPAATAILDAKQADCTYPYKELCGCGVGFKLLQALCLRLGRYMDELYRQMDLVAIAICSDIVPITGENRVFVYLGMQQINAHPRPGVKALANISGFKILQDVQDIVFGLGPRINAAGRMAKAGAAVELLLSETEMDAIENAKVLNERNLNRKDIDSRITGEALEMIASDPALSQAASTVLYKEDWHKGVIGIVASRCIEKYYRPTIILTRSGNHASGSARSVVGFDVHEAIGRCSDLLEQYGGHKYAAGLSLSIDNIPAFRQKFEAVVAESLLPEQRIPQLEIDLKLGLEELSYKFYRIMRQMAPFGPQNMQPVFVCENLSDKGSVRLLKEQHLKLSLTHESAGTIDAIGFFMPQHFERIKKGDKFNLCFSLEENEFNGNRSLQLQIRDIKFVD